MTGFEVWILVVQAIYTFATIIIAIWAIWGEWFRSRWLGRKLTVVLQDPAGGLTRQNDGTKVRYYHPKVSNSCRCASARNVRVVVTHLARAAAGGPTPPLRQLSSHPQLTWAYSEWHPQYSTIGPDEVCDLGYAAQNGAFKLTPYIFPNNFEGALNGAGRLLVEVRAVADNAQSKPIQVEVGWDGIWCEDTAGMSRHLLVRTVG